MKYHCDACKDEDRDYGNICQECCEHAEHDHFICMDCGLKREASDYYDEDYGLGR